jgi:CheY-like chemotaxis protein
MSNEGAPRALATILAVDDRAVNLTLKRSLFEPLGYRVITAAAMDQALSLAREAVPDLIISDIEMSAGGNGFDFIEQVKADPKLSSIPFVFLTSTHVNERSRAKGLALGAALFLFRPLDSQTLLAEIENLLPPDKRR